MYTDNYLSSFPTLYSDGPREKKVQQNNLGSDKLIYHHMPCLPSILQAMPQSISPY